MPTYEHNVLQQHKDQNGDMHIDYPITKPENVVGLYESPALTGVPTAPTAEKGTNTEQIATTEFVQTELSEIKKELSDGMTLVADAITEKGVETATDATLEVMAANIRKIETGGGELHGATIAVTTAEETLVGMTVTLSKEGVTVQNKTFDENGICSFTDIQVIGDYTISSGNGEENASETISVTGDNIVNKTILHCELSFILDGSVAVPLNDVATWLKTDSTGMSLSKGYTTLAQVIADTTTLNNLMANKSAMQYLARSTGFADEGCASETFMIYLGKSTYLDSTVLNSDLWVEAIKQSPYKNKVLPQADLVVGNTYKFGGYNWIVAEKSDVSGYAVLQSTGLTGGTWPGYAMSGTLTNAAGSTITLTGANTHYTGNIDGYDISNYNSTTQSLYSSIKAAEYTSATYGKGLYLVSNAKAGAGTTSNGSQGSGYYWLALKSAAANYSSFGAPCDGAWFGTVYGSNSAWFVNQYGHVYNSYYSGQDDSLVVAPAFNLDTCLIKVSEDEIVL